MSSRPLMLENLTLTQSTGFSVRNEVQVYSTARNGEGPQQNTLGWLVSDVNSLHGFSPIVVCLESPSKSGSVPSNWGAHFFLVNRMKHPLADPSMEGPRNSWVELNGIYSCIGYGHGPGILHPRLTQLPAHMSSGIDCGWSSILTVDRMWMINFSIKKFLKNMEELFIFFCSEPGFPDTLVIFMCPHKKGENCIITL